uniref:Uncharacterized protein n=1 Tax=Physcomitrium patens TaxID=3218 RepID=A0A2K1J130_PHYPA|nr:hypothetical protein PHYPA_023124 [Physcomitrium patens]
MILCISSDLRGAIGGRLTRVWRLTRIMYFGKSIGMCSVEGIYRSVTKSIGSFCGCWMHRLVENKVPK